MEPHPAPAAAPPPVLALSTETRQAIEEKLFGIRGQLEYYYAQQKKIERRSTAAQADAAAREKELAALIKELLRVTDSFDDIFRCADQDRKLRKQKEMREAFQITYETLLHVLEVHGVHKVPLNGKTYSTVEFRGTRIFEPWAVVSGGNEGKVVRQVLRALWVRETPQGLQIIRRGQVVY